MSRRLLMKGKMYDREKGISSPHLTSPKIDGMRAEFDYIERSFFTYNGIEIVGLDELTNAVKYLGINIDGEIKIPGISAAASNGKIMSLNQVTGAEFHVFDLPKEDTGIEDRLSYLEKEIKAFGHSLIKFVPHYRVRTKEEIEKFYKTFRYLGFEGAMLKKCGSLYVNRKCSLWQKMKEEITEDIPCTGFIEGNGKYKGTLGSLIGDYNGKPVKAGGFSDQIRDEIWANQDSYIGKMFEVVAQEKTEKGSLRHPRFKGWRPDLD